MEFSENVDEIVALIMAVAGVAGAYRWIICNVLRGEGNSSRRAFTYL